MSTNKISSERLNLNIKQIGNCQIRLYKEFWGLIPKIESNYKFELKKHLQYIEDEKDSLMRKARR